MRALTTGLRRRCHVREGDRVLVAVSGGADSVALLRALHLLAPRRTWRLSLAVAHVQHHLRPDAEGDAAFVAGLAEQLKLPAYRRDLDPTAWTGNTEAAARQARYAALTDAARDADATHVATAHHADDQLETLLMRLLRGTAPQGFTGIPWTRPLTPDNQHPVSNTQLIRPLLAATHAHTRDFLRQLDQPWREDPTNTDRSRTRARLRHEVLPVLRDLNPAAALHASQLADRLRDSLET